VSGGLSSGHTLPGGYGDAAATELSGNFDWRLNDILERPRRHAPLRVPGALLCIIERAEAGRGAMASCMPGARWPRKGEGCRQSGLYRGAQKFVRCPPISAATEAGGLIFGIEHPCRNVH
jgi:hypothetical protein